MQLLSQEWSEAYTDVWNNDETIRRKLKRFNSVFKYRIEDKVNEVEPIILVVESGEITYAGPESDEYKVEFDMWADTQSWEKVFNKEISVKKAMMSKGFGFNGPKLKAMTNMGSFERSIQLMIDMPNIKI